MKGGIVAVAVVLLLTGCTAQPVSFTTHGTFMVPGAFSTTTDLCAPDDGYSDVRPGMQIVVEDESSKTLAVGTLGEPESASGECVFKFTVTGVPTGHKFYKVVSGRRGAVEYTENQLRTGVNLTLGD